MAHRESGRSDRHGVRVGRDRRRPGAWRPRDDASAQQRGIDSPRPAGPHRIRWVAPLLQPSGWHRPEFSRHGAGAGGRRARRWRIRDRPAQSPRQRWRVPMVGIVDASGSPRPSSGTTASARTATGAPVGAAENRSSTFGVGGSGARGRGSRGSLRGGGRPQSSAESGRVQPGSDRGDRPARWRSGHRSPASRSARRRSRSPGGDDDDPFGTAGRDATSSDAGHSGQCRLPTTGG